MEINAAVLRTFGGGLKIERVEIDGPRPDEVQVRMAATGICHTDIKMAAANSGLPLPLVMGHEGAGIVTALGESVRGLSVGDHVILSFASCGHCPTCLASSPYYCDDIAPLNFGGARRDGTTGFSQNGVPIHSHFFGQSSFAERANVNARCVLKVDPDLPLEFLGPLGCGIQTGAGSVLNVFKAQAGSSIAIFGVGAVGLSAVMAAAIAGATTIVAIDTVEGRLNTALELGATHVIRASQKDSADAIMRIKPRGLDYCLDTTGSATVVSQACAVLGTSGVCGLLSSSEELTIAPGMLMRRGARIQGIGEGESNPPVFIPKLLELHKAGRLPFERLITFYPFEEIDRAIADARAGVAIKPVLRFG